MACVAPMPLKPPSTPGLNKSRRPETEPTESGPSRRRPPSVVGVDMGFATA